MRRFSWIALFLALGGAATVHAQQPEPPRKQARAIRVAAGAIALDGRLDEDVWSRAPVVTDFTQKEPVEGAAPSDTIQVSFAYDDTALYVGARMASARAPIQAPLGRRDDVGQAEY